jgi:membrane protease YdiL (CAAX protease family)
MTKLKAIDQRLLMLLLITLPFFVTFLERAVIAPLISIFPLPDTSVYLFKVGSISLILLSLSSFFGQSYGLEIPKNRKLAKIISALILLLISISYLFLFSLRLKGFFDSIAMIYLVNWILTVFREEFILRGIIQTQASYFIKGKLLRISLPIWISMVAFSLWHLANLPFWSWQVVALQMLSCLPSGLILGWIREKTGNTLLTYLLHICGDLLFFSLYTLIFGKLFFSLW